MSLAEIEAELEKLTPDELRRIALKSWAVWAGKQGCLGADTECDEDNSLLLAALDDAWARAEATPGAGRSGDEVRAQLSRWNSR